MFCNELWKTNEPMPALLLLTVLPMPVVELLQLLPRWLLLALQLAEWLRCALAVS